MDALFHIVDAQVWADAVVAGAYRAPSLASEGFVHCSFRDQVAGTVARYYADVPDLVVVELDPGAIHAPVVVEDVTASGTRFPHVYGTIPTAAARAVHQLTDFGPRNDAASPDR